jgi:hypothetical protein
MPENGKILLRSFFLFSLFGAGLLTVINKKWLGLTVLSVAFVILASVRDGIINAFLPGRSGTILTVVGMAILCLYVFEIRKNRSSDGFEKTVSVGIAALFALILVSTSLVFTGSVHDYRYHNNLTSIPDGPGNVANVVNVVNKNSDTYWLGPMDFYSQILITSHNASRYTFYLPWHAACPECKQELLNDLKTKQPNVVYWEDAGAIHGHPTAEYGKDIKDFLQASGYYRVTDGRLAFFYFNPNNKAEIDQKLKDAGFAL